MPDMRLFGLIALLSTTLCVTICTGCGGKGETTGVLLVTPLENTQRYDYGQTIAGLAVTPAPDGVEQGLWRELTIALAEALVERQAADAPLIDAARVNDLSYNLAADPETTFSWDYRNPGDYDLNGEVNVADLTKIAEHFMASDVDANWPSSLVVDGDGNGEVNIADVTLIAQNFMAVVSGYLLQTSDDAMSAQWADAGQMDYADATVPEGGGMPGFNLELAAAVFGQYYRVVPFEKTTSGEVVRTNTGAAGVPVLFTPDARGDWHTLGANAQHTSLSTHEGPTTNHVYWTHEIGGNGRSSPVYNSAGTIYVGGGDGLYAINSDHTSVSVFPTPDVVETTPAIAKDGTVYFGCNDGVFRALAPGGGLKWSFTTGGAIHCSPTVAEDGTVYFGSDDSNLYALTPDGSLKWTVEGEKPIWVSPALTSDGHIFAVVNGGMLQYLDKDGNVDWDDEDGKLATSSPMVCNLDSSGFHWGIPPPAIEGEIESIVFTTEGSAFGFPVGPILAELQFPLQWRLPSTWEGAYATPALSPDGGLYFVDYNKNLSRFDKEQSPMWEEPYFLCTSISQSPTVDSAGRVYMGKYYKGLIAVGSDNSMLWELPTDSRFTSQVALSGSTIYAVDDDGWLYAIGGPLNVTLPGVPAGLVAEKESYNGSIEVSWDQANGSAYYELFRDTQSNLLATIETGTAYLDTGIEMGVQHEYWIRAVNSVGFSELSVGVLGNTRLTSPTNVVASEGLYPDKIVIYWDAVPNAETYEIFRDGYASMWPDGAFSSQTTWSDTAASDWDTHRYWVKANNSFSTSWYSDEATGWLTRGAGDSGAGNWNQYGANPGHTRQASVSGPTDSSFAWVYQPDVRFEISSFSAPVFGSEGAIYLPGYETMRCLNPDGSLRWSAESNCYFPVVAPDGKIFTTRDFGNPLDWGEDNSLVVLNADGIVNSVFDTIKPSSLAITENGTLIATESNSVVSFNLDASINWRYTHEVPIKRAPVSISADGSIYFGSGTWLSAPAQGGGEPSKNPTDLNALNPDGTLRWVKHFDDSLSIPIAGPDGTVLFRDYEGERLVALNPDGSTVWENSYPEHHFYLSLGTDGTILVAQGNGRVDTLSSAGTPVWSKDFSEYAAWGFSGSPIIDIDGNIFLLGRPDTDSFCAIACGPDGLLDWTLTRGASDMSSVALDDFGRLFFGGRETIDERYTRNLYCIGPPL